MIPRVGTLHTKAAYLQQVSGFLFRYTGNENGSVKSYAQN